MSIYKSKFKFYVYAYLREDLTPYYIGKGSGNRAWNNHRTFKPPKDKSRIIILHKKLSEYKSLEIEKFLIAWYGRKDQDNKTGILHNHTDGGEGTSGHIKSPEMIYNHTESISREYIIMNPDGKIFKIKNLTNFCRKNWLNNSYMIDVAKRKKRHHKFWQCRYLNMFTNFYDPNELIKRFRASEKYTAISPTGIETTVYNLSLFCKENKLHHGHMIAVVKGRYLQHKGWKCRYVIDPTNEDLQDTNL